MANDAPVTVVVSDPLKPGFVVTPVTEIDDTLTDPHPTFLAVIVIDGTVALMKYVGVEGIEMLAEGTTKLRS